MSLWHNKPRKPIPTYQEFKETAAERMAALQAERESIARRRDEAEARRAAREQHWLDQEREKYGLKRRGIPLSRQPA